MHVHALNLGSRLLYIIDCNIHCKRDKYFEKKEKKNKMNRKPVVGAGPLQEVAGLGSLVEPFKALVQPLRKKYAPAQAVSDDAFDLLKREFDRMPGFMDKVCISGKKIKTSGLHITFYLRGMRTI